MTTSDTGHGYEAGPPTADDLRAVSFTQASMLHPGYTDREVDQFVARAADELARLSEENEQLRRRVAELQAELETAAARPTVSDQAVGILATAQLTADEYVAEAEDFSRQMTSEARAQYEEQLSEARERAGAIIQAATEARAAIAGSASARGADGPDTAALQEQIAYLKAFGQATRVQLRAYLEALLRDVETEWGRAHPAVLPPELLEARDRQAPAGNTAMALTDDAPDQPAEAPTRTVVPSTRARS
jgi:DivIVA domain-containing protein